MNALDSVTGSTFLRCQNPATTPRTQAMNHSATLPFEPFLSLSHCSQLLREGDALGRRATSHNSVKLERT